MHHSTVDSSVDMFASIVRSAVIAAVYRELVCVHNQTPVGC
jgi:hypothetical protein